MSFIRSTDEKCPNCKSEDWKLAEMIYLSGRKNVSYDTAGSLEEDGWFGDGDSYTYDGETSGIEQTELSKRYAPPKEPDDLNFDLGLISMHTEKLEDIIEALALFANDQMKLNNFFNFGRSDRNIEERKEMLENCIASASEGSVQEVDFNLWKESRVCMRCGTQFFPASTEEPVARKIVTEIKFKGLNHRCPKCKSYQWKNAKIYFAIKTEKLKSKIAKKAAAFEENAAQETVSHGGGFFGKIKVKMNGAIANGYQNDISKLKKELEVLLNEQSSLSDKFKDKWGATRICLMCFEPYLLPSSELSD